MSLDYKTQKINGGTAEAEKTYRKVLPVERCNFLNSTEIVSLCNRNVVGPTLGVNDLMIIKSKTFSITDTKKFLLVIISPSTNSTRKRKISVIEAQIQRNQILVNVFSERYVPRQIVRVVPQQHQE